MPDSTHDQSGERFRMSPAAWAALSAAAALLAVGFLDAIRTMSDTWFTRPEYSHGLVIPVLAAFLVWQKKDELATERFTGSWWGLAVVAGGALLHLVGHIATLYVIQQYAMLLVVYGVILSFTGWPAFRRLWMPLLVLVFMIPLPQFLLANLSSYLQLLSSTIGVWFIRLFGISVFLEGNVIDLGEYKLQVAEACDGLRYLFPLMTLGFIVACFYKAAFWKRALIFLSSIPITILMNSFRIGVIGVTVEHWGVSMAEGFLHEFQGWVVFMASAGLMVLQMILLSRIGPDRRPWRELFAVELPARAATGRRASPRTVPHAMTMAVALLGVYVVAVSVTPERAEAVPLRPAFSTFPDQLGPWSGRPDSFERVYLDALKMSDYYLGNFRRGDSPPVNFYVAWYDSQRAGRSTHSPRSCLPGGGWRIDELSQVPLRGASTSYGPITVNRALISQGSDRQLVYYWFRQRGRNINNEYAVKWYLFWDALTAGRTDGALVRITTVLQPGEDPAQGDRRLVEFAEQAVPRLAAYIPD
jgi:exosortase D (VPLPA-CTERM-specific)